MVQNILFLVNILVIIFTFINLLRILINRKKMIKKSGLSKDQFLLLSVGGPEKLELSAKKTRIGGMIFVAIASILIILSVLRKPDYYSYKDVIVSCSLIVIIFGSCSFLLFRLSKKFKRIASEGREGR